MGKMRGKAKQKEHDIIPPYPEKKKKRTANGPQNAVDIPLRTGPAHGKTPTLENDQRESDVEIARAKEKYVIPATMPAEKVKKRRI